MRYLSGFAALATLAAVCGSTQDVLAQDLGLVHGQIPGPAERSAALNRATPAAPDRPPPPAGLAIRVHDFHQPSKAVLDRLSEKTNRAKSSARDNRAEIPGSYIVTFKKDTFPYVHRARGGELDLIDPSGMSLSETANGIAQLLGGELVFAYAFGNGAFCALLTEEQAKELSTLPHIERVEPDALADYATATTNWALDRLDQRTPPLNFSYAFGSNGTTPVHIYIIDSGVLGTHSEFAGRFSTGYSATGQPHDQDVAGPGIGHGTAVAGAAAGTTTGVAVNAILHSVRVSDINGGLTTSAIAAGIQWVRDHRQAPAVANLSLETAAGGVVGDAIISLIGSGVPVTIAAGNRDALANGAGIGDTWDSIVVGATVLGDSRATPAHWGYDSNQSPRGSNYGARVDLFAPGDNLTLPDRDGAVYQGSWGTSFAAPYVAGIVALYLSSHPNATPAEVESAVKANTTRNIVTNAGANTVASLAYAKSGWLNLDTLVADGTGTVTDLNVQHPNGNVYDQVLLTGTTVTVTSDPGQVTRVAWIDENDDIVQAEFTGPGSLKVTLENSSGPALPLKYNQSVQYMKGRAKFEFCAATAATYFSVFSVGTTNAVNQGLFIPGMQYDGIADVKSLRLEDSMKMGGILMGNAIFRGTDGIVGIDANSTIFKYVTNVTNRLVIRDLKAGGSAAARFLLGPSPLVDSLLPPPFGSNRGYAVVAGGDLVQTHGDKIASGDLEVPGFLGFVTNPNQNSHGVTVPPLHLNGARLARVTDGFVYSLPYTTVNYSPALSGNTSPN